MLTNNNVSQELTPDSGDDSGSDTSRGGAKSATNQPKKLAELDVVNLDQIVSMSGNTLLRIFTETDFDEMKRMYCYSCHLIPSSCSAKFQSFGNESKAKKEMRQHLLEHVKKLAKDGNKDFVAEPIMARKKRTNHNGVGATVKPQVIRKRVKSEPLIETEVIIEEATTEVPAVDVDMEHNVIETKTKCKVKKEAVEVQDNIAIKKEAVERREVKVQSVTIVSDQTAGGSRSETSGGSRTTIDEDHCYAFKPGRVKAEYWPGYDNNAATAFTSIQVRSLIITHC